jgi:hypothetical protein
MVLTDAIVRDTLPRELDDESGRGVSAEEGGRIEGHRLLVERNYEAGGLAAMPGSVLSLTDSIVRDNEGRVSDSGGGMGILAPNGSRVETNRVLISGNREVGEPRNDYGYAVGVQGQARLSGRRVLIERAREVGILSHGEAAVMLEDLTVADVMRSDCDCERVLGHGIAVVAGRLQLVDFDVQGIATCGLFVSRASGEPTAPEVDLESGTIRQTEIGVCTQVDGYDLSRLTNGVVFEDNVLNLDSTMLPVPTAVGMLGE